MDPTARGVGHRALPRNAMEPAARSTRPNVQRLAPMPTTRAARGALLTEVLPADALGLVLYRPARPRSLQWRRRATRFRAVCPQTPFLPRSSPSKKMG